jgi:ADP-heptose:LPS heptosyltransferase
LRPSSRSGSRGKEADVFSYLRLLYYLLRPGTVFLRRTSNGLGDNLLLTALLPELKRLMPDRRIVVETPWKEIFYNNPYVDWVTDRHIKTTKRHIKPVYRVEGRGDRPFLEQMMRYIDSEKVGSPRIYLSEHEMEAAKAAYPGGHVAVCPTGKVVFSSNRREWGLDRFQELRNLLSECRFVQVGLAGDPLLENVSDARGLPIRESAAIIANARFFLGLEGGFMHVAKAVGTKSVVIFGGYMLPEVSGYPENVNITSEVDCSPCYNSHVARTPCDSMKCMKAVSPRMVYDVIMREIPGPCAQGDG